MKLTPLILSASLLIAGCAPATGYITVAPPGVVVQEEIGVAPGPDYVWVAGSYEWQNNVYVWVPGRWIVRPFRGAVWVGPVWRHHSRHGWFRTPGHWRH